ncbi:MAG TPA: alpha/beta hydrolase [Burkholderiales bacterium]|nr:alpha/beta hydrolase [Burkholderiales bacterium]
MKRPELMKRSESRFLDIRGLRYHLRCWPRPGAPKIVLLHGWMDVSASFQFLVDALRGDWEVFAPDWRGYGLTDWAKSDCYWFPDYIADLDFLLREIEPSAPVNLVGHSLGGNVAALYAGVRPERVRRLVNLEGFGLPATEAAQAPGRYARWLDELHERPQLRPYASFAELAERLRRNNPRLTQERAQFLARHWGKEEGEGGAVSLRGDPAHKVVNPLLYRYEEVRAVWQQVSAPVLWVDAAESDTLRRMKLDPAEQAARRAAFRDLRHATVQGAGHMLHHDQPERVAALMEDFFLR